MLILICILIRRELALGLARPGEALRGVVFYLLLATIFPLALSEDADLLSRIVPAVLWAGALLAMMLAVPELYREDASDGTLDQYRLLPMPLEGVAVAKILSCWLMNGLPLLLAAPLLMKMLHAAAPAGLTILALAIGLLGLAALGSLAAAITAGLKRSSAIISLLTLPLTLPILIFGAHITSSDALLFLCGVVLAILPLSVWLSAIALKEA